MKKFHAFAGLFLAFCIAVGVVVGTEVASRPNATPHSRYSTHQCHQITASVTDFTRRYLGGRKNQVVHCRAGYVMFETVEHGKRFICRASITLYHKDQFIPMFGKDCIGLGVERRAPHPQPKLHPSAPLETPAEAELVSAGSVRLELSLSAPPQSLPFGFEKALS